MNRRALLIGAAAALVVLLAWYFLLWGPRNDEITEARDRQDTAESEAQQLQSEIERLRAAQRDEPLRRAQLETLRAAIPDDPNLAQFILDTNDAATKAGIEFISIAPTPPVAAAAQPATAATTATTTATTTPGAGATPPAEIKVALQVQGGYFQVLDFVNRLNDLSRLVVIDSVNVTADPAGRLSAALQARMFTRALPAGFGGTTTTTTGPAGATTTTAPGGATTTTVAGGATTTTAAGGVTTTTAGAQP